MAYRFLQSEWLWWAGDWKPETLRHVCPWRVCVCRKQDLRELKLLQKQENKQYQDLVYKNEMSTDAQMRKFEADMQVGRN